jgi:hypothetical protein
MTHHITSRAALLAVVIALLGLTSAGARGDNSSFVAGSGTSYAQVLRVGPTAARLSLAPTLGLSLSDYSGTVGRGQATDADLAAIGVAQPCTAAQIPTLRVVSTDKDADKGKTQFFAGSSNAGAGELFARATVAPFGESHFRLGSFSIPGVMTVGEGFAATSVGVLRNGVRQATAAVELSSFDFGGGAVKLSGLRWDAVQQTSEKGRKVTSTFTVQGARAGGVPLNLPAGGGDIATILGPLNTALAPTGFAIRPPVNDSVAGVASMSPLAIEIRNSALGRQFLAPALGAIQPIREPLANQLIPLLKMPHDLTASSDTSCNASPSAPDLSVAVLLADLSLGIFAGSADFHLELGGVNAYTEGARFTNPFLGNFGKVPPLNTSLQTLTNPGSPGTPGVPGTPGLEQAQLAVSPPGAAQHTIPGSKGGNAVAVGAFGLAAAILLAAADWYRMRSLHR